MLRVLLFTGKDHFYPLALILFQKYWEPSISSTHFSSNDVESLDRWQKELEVNLRLFEQIFPPNFFVILVHLIVYLVEEVKLHGPIYLIWMYLFEWCMKVYKGYYLIIALSDALLIAYTRSTLGCRWLMQGNCLAMRGWQKVSVVLSHSWLCEVNEKLVWGWVDGLLAQIIFCLSLNFWYYFILVDLLW